MEEILEIWLDLPLVDRMRLYADDKIKGLEKVSVSDLFPEKRKVEQDLMASSLAKTKGV